ncbi:hypothetical protein F5X98DRAFT_385444 [Xylaria grammica]|nr:hypothetical protein F5X98DRAFT_385444 [Xylaria grammica]
MHRLGLSRGELSSQIPVTKPPNDTSPPTQSTSPKCAKPISRVQSRTFPQSRKERMDKSMASSSIDSRLEKGSAEVENAAARDEEALRKRRQPVPDDFGDLDKGTKKKLHDTVTFDAHVKLLEADVRREQGGRQSTDTQASKRFVEIWEARLLPRIEEVLDANIRGEYTVNVSRGPGPGNRTVVIMTEAPVTDAVEQRLREAKAEILPHDLDATTALVFRQGSVEFLADPGAALSRVSSHDSEDSCTSPVNTHWSPDPAIGDSVGWETEAATLGPLLQINQRFYRLVCWHLFDDRATGGTNYRWKLPNPPPGLSTYRPSPRDSRDWNHAGDVVAYSGPMYATSRRSESIQNGDVVTDWALIESTEAIERTPQPNIVRRNVPTSTHTYDVQVTRDEDPASYRQAFRDKPWVYSVGRTSGYTTGQLGLTHGTHKLRSGKKTKNWTVENLSPGDAVAAREWTRAGMGVPGDSGAGVFGFWDDALLGQVWGRNAYTKQHTEPRLTFFAALADVRADILAKMPGGASAVVLPTPESITECRGPREGDLDPVARDLAWPAGEHAALEPIRKFDEADFKGDDRDQDHGVGRRSAATSRAAVLALGKRVSLFEPPRWAKVIIHAATF